MCLRHERFARSSLVLDLAFSRALYPRAHRQLNISNGLTIAANSSGSMLAAWSGSGQRPVNRKMFDNRGTKASCRNGDFNALGVIRIPKFHANACPMVTMARRLHHGSRILPVCSAQTRSREKPCCLESLDCVFHFTQGRHACGKDHISAK